MLLAIKFITIIATFKLAGAILVRQENSLYGPYEAGAPNVIYWDLTGSSQLEQTFIRLTPEETGKQGGLWNNYPVVSNDWELHIQFHIHGKDHPSGSGLAIWYVHDILHLGPVFGSKDYFSGLGIFIHTEDPSHPHSHSHPYISAMVNNGTQSYEHNEDGTVHQVGGCHMPLRNLEWPTKIAVSYIGNVLTVFLDVEGKEQWTQCFRSEGIHLPTHYYFGISASTDEVNADNHDILYITALDMNQPEKEWEDRSYVIPHAENVLLHPRQAEIQKTVEELQNLDEQILKFEEKREIKDEEIEDAEKLTEKKFAEKFTEEKRETERLSPPKVEKISPKTVSLMTKVIYVAGAAVILFCAYSVFKKKYAQRKERMQKRLY